MNYIIFLNIYINEDVRPFPSHPCRRHCWCGHAYRTKADLRRHKARDHRRSGPPGRHLRLEPEVPPADVECARVRMLYKVGCTAPAGFASSQLPLAKISYLHEGKWASGIICSYQLVKERYPVELCNFMISHIKLLD